MKRKKFSITFIQGIEKIGNKLPHPFWIFVILTLIILFSSFIVAKLGVTVTYITAKAGEAPQEISVSVVNLLSFPEMREYIQNFSRNYVTFPSLGPVMIMLMGVGLIEQTGFISTVIKKVITSAHPYIATGVLAFVGVNSNIASDAGLLIAPTIGAAVFKAMGRNPWIGIITGYAAASGGISANLFISNLDVNLAGITESTARSMNISGGINPLMNWYFMATATFVIAISVAFLAEKYLVKIIGDTPLKNLEKGGSIVTTDEERKGLKMAGLAFILFTFIILILTLPENAFFRNSSGKFLPASPLLSSVTPILFLLFSIVGTAYGVGAGTIKSFKQVPLMMQKQLQGTASYFITVLPASAFIYFFGRSRLTTILAVQGADWLKDINLGGVPLIIMLILLCSVMNLIMGSSAAKWLILAPIFIPMFSMVGFSPALTQVAFRIGDSATNIISPIAGAVPFILALLEQYKPEGSKEKVGIGTIIALELPFTILLFTIQTGMLIIWYLLRLPLGPGVY